MSVKRLGLWLIAAMLASPLAATPPSVPPPGSPALASLGTLAVGRTTLNLSAEAAARPLRVILWYPAAPAKGTVAPAPYRWRVVAPPPLPAIDVSFAALAAENAAPAAGRHPLIIVSHGFGSSPEHMSYLGENLASKGYVVAGIDHADPSYADAATFQKAFGQAAAFRARDQQRVIAALTQPAAPASSRIDARKIAVIGYSMGGFGALATAGSGYDPSSVVMKSLAPDAMADQAEGRRADPRLKAVVAIAPWGAQAPYRAWSPRGLAAVRVPLLVIAGEADDVSNYADGIRPAFEAATGSDRYLLLYRAASHNVGGNPLPAEAATLAEYRGFFEEPVWRTERLNAINLHFVTAFLGRHLKNDAAHAAMLEPPAAGAEWPGFPRRSALGFELIHRAPAP